MQLQPAAGDRWLVPTRCTPASLTGLRAPNGQSGTMRWQFLHAGPFRVGLGKGVPCDMVQSNGTRRARSHCIGCAGGGQPVCSLQIAQLIPRTWDPNAPCCCSTECSAGVAGKQALGEMAVCVLYSKADWESVSLRLHLLDQEPGALSRFSLSLAENRARKA